MKLHSRRMMIMDIKIKADNNFNIIIIIFFKLYFISRINLKFLTI